MRIKESWIVALFLFITTLAAVSAVPSLNILEDTVSVSVAPNKDKIGEVLGVQLPTAAACIIESGESQGLLDQIIPKLKEQTSTG